VIHGVLGLDHRVDGGRLRDVVLRAGLLDKHEVGVTHVTPCVVMDPHGP
jgi:hypothetical protein